MCECCGGDCKIRGKIMLDDKQEYQSELLEAYSKISDTFDDFTQLMRKRVPYHSWPQRCKNTEVSDDLKGNPEINLENTSHLLISRVKDLGRAQEKLKFILDDEIFDRTNKHNAYWNTESEADWDKLDDLRRKFALINENLWDLMAILKTGDE